MRLRLPELQNNNKKAKVLKAESLPEGWKDVEGVLQYQGLPYIPQLIGSKVISRQHNNPFIRYFGTDKTRESIGRKYYWPSQSKDVKTYNRGCDICLASKVVHHKAYKNLQFLPISTHQRKNLSMDFVTGLPLSVD